MAFYATLEYFILIDALLHSSTINTVLRSTYQLQIDFVSKLVQYQLTRTQSFLLFHTACSQATWLFNNVVTKWLRVAQLLLVTSVALLSNVIIDFYALVLSSVFHDFIEHQRFQRRGSFLPTFYLTFRFIIFLSHLHLNDLVPITVHVLYIVVHLCHLHHVLKTCNSL